MFVRQTIEIRPNNKQKTYFRQCFGAHRLAYNYGLCEWIRLRDSGQRTNCRDIRTQFNKEKKAGQWPFLKRISSAATCYAFDDLQRAFDNFFKGHEKIKQGGNDEVSGFPKPKNKSYNHGSYTEYFPTNNEGGAKILDHRVKMKMHKRRDGSLVPTYADDPSSKPCHKRPYLLLPKLGCVRMTRPLRYEGRPVSVTIRQKNERFYACFLVEITEEEFIRVHPRYAQSPTAAIGIDLGIKELAVTSDGLMIENLRFWERQLIHENKLQERMNHCSCAKQKKSGNRPGKNFLRLKQQLWRLRTRIRNRREDLRNRLCGVILANYQYISIETLSIKKMAKSVERKEGKKKLNAHLADVGLYEIRHRLETLGELLGRKIIKAPINFPSTRRCCQCGHVEQRMTFNQRIYRCPECGNVIDRDLNAAINLRNLTGIGNTGSMPEVSPMRSDLIRNNIRYREIDNGKKVGTRS
jgi:putative transposase